MKGNKNFHKIISKIGKSEIRGNFCEKNLLNYLQEEIKVERRRRFASSLEF
jgi:hypothetical protein